MNARKIRDFYRTTTPAIREQALNLFRNEGEKAAIAYLEILCSKSYFTRQGSTYFNQKATAGVDIKPIPGETNSLQQIVLTILQANPKGLQLVEIANALADMGIAKDNRCISNYLSNLRKKKAIYTEKRIEPRRVYHIYYFNPDWIDVKARKQQLAQKIRQLIDAGLDNRRIARRCGCSVRQVSNHRTKFRKAAA